MRAQNRCWSHRTDRSFETSFDRRGFASFGNYRDDLFRFEDLPHGHGDRSRRHRREIGEPAFADLLPPAGFLQVHDNVGVAGFEIRWGIVKCEMAVFSDADKRNINRRCEYGLPYNQHFWPGRLRH